ncbi:hypothetical protein [Arthrobacter sp. B2a2-09]|uniref:hypothetical protein n=1 Tax=Arthrobacter sp. B2a2-09 TaxID=2952822 RepID=UPI0022CD8716|nr:hypothetical protein [Arthrobacter sp. B2a2-09]
MAGIAHGHKGCRDFPNQPLEHGSSGRDSLLQVFEVQSPARPHHSFAVQNATGRTLFDRRGLQVKEVIGQKPITA